MGKEGDESREAPWWQHQELSILQKENYTKKGIEDPKGSQGGRKWRSGESPRKRKNGKKSNLARTETWMNRRMQKVEDENRKGLLRGNGGKEREAKYMELGKKGCLFLTDQKEVRDGEQEKNGRNQGEVQKRERKREKDKRQTKTDLVIRKVKGFRKGEGKKRRGRIQRKDRRRSVQAKIWRSFPYERWKEVRDERLIYRGGYRVKEIKWKNSCWKQEESPRKRPLRSRNETKTYGEVLEGREKESEETKKEREEGGKRDKEARVEKAGKIRILKTYEVGDEKESLNEKDSKKYWGIEMDLDGIDRHM